ncbi:brain acid soluble protein 1 homolog [Drosophila tropicalis]|uniref:brain acid soluble protein 1 homolog n=1 Tax=Drosophila tropicalis TaxID=46794 RepID=UPI0035ABA0C8
MLDKLKLNNLVITNKKLILKARVQTISKLVQKLRKTKTKAAETQKDKDRTRKYMECITELKTQKPVELMRQVLAKSGGNTKAVLTNGLSSPNELAMAMLEENKIMSQLLNNFRQELKLSTDKGKVEWREEILEVSKRQAKFQRTEEKKRKRKELKEIKANDKKREEWLKENQQGLQEGEENVKEEQEEHDQTKNIEPTETSNPEDTPSKALAKEKQKKLKEKLKTKPNKSNESNQKKLTKQKETLKPNLKPDAAIKQRSTKPETNANEATKQKPAKLKEKPIKKAAKDRPTHVIDPFFITQSGQPYLSTAIDNSDDEEDEKAPRQAVPPAPAENGWRKQKYENSYERPATTQTQGEGKKIKFNDDGEATVTATAPTPSPAAPTVSTEGMHPSWVAKQKWKPKIAEFQGTKIKFDD